MRSSVGGLLFENSSLSKPAASNHLITAHELTLKWAEGKRKIIATERNSFNRNAVVIVSILFAYSKSAEIAAVGK